MKPSRRKQSALSQDELKSLLKYCPETGIFVRIKDSQKYKSGHIAGHKNKGGYTYIKINYEGYLAHRLAWFYMTGNWPENEIDHIDLNKRNNTWSNLRESDSFSNNYNKKLSKRNTTGAKGIWFNKDRKKWEVRIHFKGKRIHLGRFPSAEKASKAYDDAAKKLHGEFYRRSQV